MIFDVDQSVHLLLEILEVIPEPYRSVAIETQAATNSVQVKRLHKKYGPEYEDLLDKAYSLLREEMLDQGIGKLADLPL